jgi:argininosuccinate lyase
VALEHVRAIASKALGQGLGVLSSVHNTPFGDINDIEDDLQPLLYSTIRDAVRAVSLLGQTLEAAEFRADVLRDRAEANFITVTELADTIVRREGLPFSKAHAIVASCVAQATGGDGSISHDMLQAAAREHAGRPLGLGEADLATALSAENFVRVRTIHGGPSPEETRQALAAQRTEAARDLEWLDETEGRLAAAAQTLHRLSESLSDGG